MDRAGYFRWNVLDGTMERPCLCCDSQCVHEDGLVSLERKMLSPHIWRGWWFELVRHLQFSPINVFLNPEGRNTVHVKQEQAFAHEYFIH